MHNSWAQLPYHRSHHHHYMAESVITPPTRKRKKEVIRKAPLLLLLLLCLQRALAKCHLCPGHQLWQIQIVSQCQWPSSRYQLLMSCKITPATHHLRILLLRYTKGRQKLFSSKVGKMLLSDSSCSSEPKFTAADHEMQDNSSGHRPLHPFKVLPDQTGI